MRAERGTARKRLLRSTVELVAARGVNAVGVDAIAEAAGITKRTLYLHFESKDSLVGQALGDWSQAWHHWFAREVERRAETPAERILAMFDLLGEGAAEDGYRGCVFVNAAADIPDHGHPAREAASRHKAVLLSYITGLVERLGVAEPEKLARQIKLLLEGVVATALVDPGAEHARDARAIAETLILREVHTDDR